MEIMTPAFKELNEVMDVNIPSITKWMWGIDRMCYSYLTPDSALGTWVIFSFKDTL